MLPQEEATLTGIMKFKHDLAEALQQQERQRQERRCLANPALSMQEAQPCTPPAPAISPSLSPPSWSVLDAMCPVPLYGPSRCLSGGQCAVAIKSLQAPECSKLHLPSGITKHFGESQVRECLDALGAGREWQPARGGRQELLEDQGGAEMQVGRCTAYS